ncbi:hypothetical protein BDZ90DRAFT_230536 [Jaminaea rosea]|uniref:Uncharacterized protein n=1 Tax=Jaminaea rosea TaxID=1569628 RepID=A0A316UXG0_9BASI|nr:hypothetical protein BDZ90DRAFT_230536 [Jaminaea rosea]PWN29674.1 hypothetical protein BDZ90DRAFT_230536 [Jaminaea rosea]
MLVELLAVDRVDRQSIIELRLPLAFALARQQCGLDPAQSIFKPFESEAEAGALSLGSPIVYPGFGAIRSLSEVIEPHGRQESGLVFFGNEPEPIMPSLSPPPRAPRPRPRRPTTAPTTPTRSAFGALGSPDLASSKRMTMVATPPRRSSRRIAPVMPLMVPKTSHYLDVTSREELPWTPTWSTHAASAQQIGFPEGGAEHDDGPSLPGLSPSSRQAALSLTSSVRPKSRDASSSTKSSFTHGSSQGHDSSARVSFSTSATSSPNISFTATKSLFT